MDAYGLIAIVAPVSAGAGILIGFGMKWGSKTTTLRSLNKSHDGLKQEFIRHKDNKQIHRDPERDSASMADLKSLLVKIDTRCEKRGTECMRHFSQVEQRVARYTGRNVREEEEEEIEV